MGTSGRRSSLWWLRLVVLAAVLLFIGGFVWRSCSVMPASTREVGVASPRRENQNSVVGIGFEEPSNRGRDEMRTAVATVRFGRATLGVWASHPANDSGCIQLRPSPPCGPHTAARSTTDSNHGGGRRQGHVRQHWPSGPSVNDASPPSGACWHCSNRL